MDFKTGFELSNGVRIPCIGFGTWQSRDGEGVAAVKSALGIVSSTQRRPMETS